MKKVNFLLLLLLATLSLSLNSCKKEEEEEPSKSELIVGKWTWDKTEYFENGALQSTTQGDGSKVEFKKNHDIVYYDETGTIDTSSDYTTWDINEEGDLFMWIKNENEAIVFNLDKLTKSEMEMSLEQNNGGNIDRMVLYLSK